MEATAICRRLVRADPSAHEHKLAKCLNNNAKYLSLLGQHEEGLQVSKEALAIRRRLAGTDPPTHKADLASCLSLFGNQLSETGRC